jgi:hypothetical protein
VAGSCVLRVLSATVTREFMGFQCHSNSGVFVVIVLDAIFSAVDG